HIFSVLEGRERVPQFPRGSADLRFRSACASTPASGDGPFRLRPICLLPQTTALKFAWNPARTDGRLPAACAGLKVPRLRLNATRRSLRVAAFDPQEWRECL